MSKKKQIPKDQNAESAIVIEFLARGMADPNFRLDNVTPAQVLAAAAALRLLGERQLNEIWSRQEMEQMKNRQALTQVQQMVK